MITTKHRYWLAVLLLAPSILGTFFHFLIRHGVTVELFVYSPLSIFYPGLFFFENFWQAPWLINALLILTCWTLLYAFLIKGTSQSSTTWRYTTASIFGLAHAVLIPICLKLATN